MHLINTRTAYAVLCLWLSAEASAATAVPNTIESLKNGVDEYIKGLRNLNAEAEVVRLARLESGKLLEEKHYVECMMRDYAMRHACYSSVYVDGKKNWFDICETLILPSGQTVEWRHPGLPGHIAFGETSSEASLRRGESNRVGDPLYVLKRIRRSLGRDRSEVVNVANNSVKVHVSCKGNDYLEIEFSADFDWLPVRMTRICTQDKQSRPFHSGGSFSLKYARQKSGGIVPQKATYIPNLKDHAVGTLATTWIYSKLDLSNKPSVDDMALKIPVGAMSVNFDTEERRHVKSQTDEVAADLKKRFGDLVQILDRTTAKKSVSTSFVGRCPDLPDSYRTLAQIPAESIYDSSVAWRARLLILHAVAVLGITVYFRRRKNATPE